MAECTQVRHFFNNVISPEFDLEKWGENSKEKPVVVM